MGFSIRFLKNGFFSFCFRYFTETKAITVLSILASRTRIRLHCTYRFYSSGAEILYSIRTAFDVHVIINDRSVRVVSYDAETGNYSNKNPEGCLPVGPTLGFERIF